MTSYDFCISSLILKDWVEQISSLTRWWSKGICGPYVATLCNQTSGDMAKVVDENGHRYDMCYDEVGICDIDTIL